eukprot:Pgem_evm1s2137
MKSVFQTISVFALNTSLVLSASTTLSDYQCGSVCEKSTHCEAIKISCPVVTPGWYCQNSKACHSVKDGDQWRVECESSVTCSKQECLIPGATVAWCSSSEECKVQCHRTTPKASWCKYIPPGTKKDVPECSDVYPPPKPPPGKASWCRWIPTAIQLTIPECKN